MPGERRRFQSPSLRGSGRFLGATSDEEVRAQFQSPSLRGSGRFCAWSCIGRSA